MPPALGQSAPDFELPTDSGGTFRPSAFRGRPVVLFFYPEDGTEGCTIENHEFTALLPEFESLGAAVAGISPDTVADHCAFRDRHRVRVPLVADPGREAISRYGLWVEKKLYGRHFMGVKRASVIIAPDGTLAAFIAATRIKGHAAKVLAELRRFAAAGWA